jgi:capsular exopolysaccharide synthesis family protein
MHNSLKVLSSDQLRLGTSPIEDRGAGDFDPRVLITIARRRWYVIVGSLAITFCLTLWWLLNTVPIYTATAQILIDPRKERILRTEAVVGELALDTSSVATQVALIQSFAVAKRVVERLRLDEHGQRGDAEPMSDHRQFSLNALFALFSGTQAAVVNSTGATPPDADIELSPATLGAIGRVRSGVDVRRVAPTYLIEVSYSHPEPRVAAELANAFAESYIDEQLDARRLAANRATKWLREQAVELRLQVAASEQAVSEHRAKYNLTTSRVGTASGTLAAQQAGEINAQLVAARAQTVEKRARFEQAQKILEGSAGIETLAAAMESATIADLRQQEAALARSEADQLTRYGPSHPSLIRSRAERADIREQIKREVGRAITALKADYEFALKREASLEASFKELTSDENRNDQAVIRLRELERTAQTNGVLYESVLTRLKETEQQASLQTPESRIIAPAFVPGAPSYPNPKRFLILGTVGGLVLGFGLVFLLQYLENGFTTVEQIEQALHLPVLAMVPQVSKRECRIDGRVVPIPDYIFKKSLSHFSESIRSIHLGTQMSDPDQPPQLILVTSAVPSEGKTTIALCLAYSAAASNQRVLLMECDLRHPSISGHLNLDPGPGLTNLMVGTAELEQTLRRGPLPSLTILPAGPSTPYPAEMLTSERFKQTLHTLRGHYDVIYIDAPPLVPVIDSALLSRLVDKLVFVVQWRKTPRYAVRRALQTIDSATEKVAGVALSRTDLSLLSSYDRHYDYINKSSQSYYVQ